jgi:hypothetical protein
MMRVQRLAMALVLFAMRATAQGEADTLHPIVTPQGDDSSQLRPVFLPFGVGERAEYNVKFGFIPAGSGSMEVLGVDTVRGHAAFHMVFRVRGGIPGYRVMDRLESWMDTQSLAALRHRQELSEGSRDRERQFEIFPERGIYIADDKDTAATVPLPLDDGSFLYFVRTVPLEVGREYTFNRYFRPDRNPVRIKVLRRERVSVPAGTFDAIVIQPIIKTRGIFSEDGRAEVWISDDSSRVMLQMKSHLRIGSLNMYLKNYIPPKTAAVDTTRTP